MGNYERLLESSEQEQTECEEVNSKVDLSAKKIGTISEEVNEDSIMVKSNHQEEFQKRGFNSSINPFESSQDNVISDSFQGIVFHLLNLECNFTTENRINSLKNKIINFYNFSDGSEDISHN